MDPCVLCPHECRVHRLQDKKGRCGLAGTARLAATLAHHGEEPPLIQKGGSGTIFLSGCNASCCYCQNFQISRLHQGNDISTQTLAEQFLYLQKIECSNINWVTPTPHLPFLLEAWGLAREQGLDLPLVYNTNGYVKRDILQMLEGIVDIYLPDMKYGEDIWAERFSGLPNYHTINVSAVQEMHRQVGPLIVDSDGMGVCGVLVRHLVLPEKTSGYPKVFRALSEIDSRIPISVMAQYKPCFQALTHAILHRPITVAEYEDCLESLELSGLENAFIQSHPELETDDPYFPDFSQKTDDIFGKSAD